MARRKIVVIGLLGPSLDAGVKPNRWERWRPSVALAMQDDLVIHRYELLRQHRYAHLGDVVAQDIVQISPQTHVQTRPIEFDDPWDFEQVFSVLFDFAEGYPFNTEEEEYLVHITTGTHVAQICLFLLTESRHFPARLVQTSPKREEEPGSIEGWSRIIDLDLSRYDQIAARFQRAEQDQLARLKSGIDTKNAAFNHIIQRINQVALVSTAPILLTGPTGAGKSQLAQRIYELKRERRQVEGALIEVNCATLRGDSAMSALFGHKRGSFTGALRDRPGLLKAADGGLLFLDEIGELGLDEQAMLLRALETGRFLPVGADREEHSAFQLLAGTNRDLHARAQQGAFRADLLARIHLWHFRLPGLADRREDIPPNLDYELDQVARKTGRRVTFSREARDAFLAFAASPEASWDGNFRDLNGAVQRMTTLAPGGRINTPIVEEEIARLRADWGSSPSPSPSPSAALSTAEGSAAEGSAAVLGEGLLPQILSPSQLLELDRFDRVQLLDVVSVCAAAPSLSEAGRQLFAASRERRKTTNDADRLRKYLAKFALTFQQIQDALGPRR